MKKAILFVVMLSLVAFVSVSIAADAPKAATTAPAKAAATAPAPAKAVATAPAPAKPAATAPAPAIKEMKFHGKVKSVDAMAKSFVVTHEKKEMTFVVDDNTKITKGETNLTLADLKAGMWTRVEYKMAGDKMIAIAIKVPVQKGTHKAAPKAAAPEAATTK